MMLLTPLALIGLLALPAIWWLIKATPPPPRQRSFPSLMLLRRLQPRHQDTARSPLWLLLLRLAAVALLVLGLAQPVWLSRTSAGAVGSDDLLLVLDDGWSAVPHWPERLRAARALGDRALQNGHRVVLLRSAQGADGAIPDAFSTSDGARFDSMIETLHPQPWPVDRRGLIAHLPAMNGHVAVLSDGVASANDPALRDALSKIGPVSDLRWPGCDVAALGASATPEGGLHARITALPCTERHFQVRARNEQGGTLGVYPIDLPSGRSQVEAAVPLPQILRNRTERLTLDLGDAPVPGPGAIRLLDEGDRRRPVGLLSVNGDDTPLVGASFFLARALGPLAELHRGSAAQLVASPLSVMIATDGTLTNEGVRRRVADWVRHGGELIRFAGPALAPNGDAPPDTAISDPLLPVPLMGGVRQLGGPMSWGTPQKLASFPDDSPFAGLDTPSEVTVSRQVLAKPSQDLNDHVWARLTDGTPLVTAAPLGQGEVVLFHVTSASDWSNLPLSGLFPDMLQRLIQRSAGLRTGAPPSVLAPEATLDADGLLGPPPSGARPLASADFPHTLPSAMHPPGLYGPRAQRRALNLGDALPALTPEPLLGAELSPDGARPERLLAPILLAAALLLLLIDLLFSLRLRGLLGRLAMIALLILPLGAHAQTDEPAAAPPPPPGVPGAALETRLAYVITGHDDVDTASREGLLGLSHYASDRSSAQLGQPDGVRPGQDDLAFYPLLYWPITEDVQPDAKRTAALNAFIAHGGMILFDTQGAGSDLDSEGARGAQEALRRATDGLSVPPLMKLDDHHVLAHSFYLLHDFPGRVQGQPVWVARSGDDSNDDVSPVIIGAGDWARAWATDSQGNNPYAVIPGGDEQRIQAYRFGVNVVLYALTGNYKADQMRVPALLKRLGQ
ncbi:DUF4159 domain-containing protein [Kozakia baliensis]|uniref:DUF4159 domain-containing protein n=1 Tax=Kozakia baliensis TaxID=153496 RepID=UPI00345BF2B1